MGLTRVSLLFVFLSGCIFVCAFFQLGFFSNTVTLTSCHEQYDGVYILTKKAKTPNDFALYKPLHLFQIKETSFLHPILKQQMTPTLSFRNGSFSYSFPVNTTCKLIKHTLPDIIAQEFKEQTIHYPTTFIDYLKESPVTLIIGSILCIIWFYCWNNRVDVSQVAIHYNAIMKQHELYRIFTASFCHLDFLHLIFNCSSLFALVEVELYLGSIRYFFLSIWLVVFTMILTLFLQKTFQNERMLSIWSLGYSCVLFALLTIEVFLQNDSSCISLFGFCFKTYHISIPFFSFSIPFNFYPFIQLFLMKLLVPNSSFIGHLSGILLGCILSCKLIDILSPMNYMTSILIVYILFEKYLKKSISNPINSSTINHMIGSSTNTKYILIHNISFILFFIISILLLIRDCILLFYQIERIDQIAWSLMSCYLCYELKHYTKTGYVPGLLLLYFIFTITQLISMIYELTFYLTYPLSISIYSFFISSSYIAICGYILCLLCVISFIVCLQSHYPEWFIHGLETLMGSQSSSTKTVANGYIFHREVKKYNSLANSEL